MQEHKPKYTLNSASAGSATTPEVQAQTSKEAGAAESFSLVTFFLTAKKKVTLSAAIPETSKRYFEKPKSVLPSNPLPLSAHTRTGIKRKAGIRSNRV
jgi:hypothetical protein